MPHRKDSEAELLARATSGNRADFDRLYDAYFPRIYEFAIRSLREPAAAEEVTREVLTDLIEALAGSERPPEPRWVFERTRRAVDHRGGGSPRGVP